MELKDYSHESGRKFSFKLNTYSKKSDDYNYVYIILNKPNAYNIYNGKITMYYDYEKTRALIGFIVVFIIIIIIALCILYYKKKGCNWETSTTYSTSNTNLDIENNDYTSDYEQPMVEVTSGPSYSRPVHHHRSSPHHHPPPSYHAPHHQPHYSSGPHHAPHH